MQTRSTFHSKDDALKAELANGFEHFCAVAGHGGTTFALVLADSVYSSLSLPSTRPVLGSTKCTLRQARQVTGS
jgi:hypothetical protein